MSKISQLSKAYKMSETFQFAESATIKFAKDWQDPLYEKFPKSTELKYTHFSYPDDREKKNTVCKLALKLLQQEDYLRLISDSIVYFILGNSALTTYGVIASSKGILFNAVKGIEFIRKENISDIQIDDKKSISIIQKDGQSKKISDVIGELIIKNDMDKAKLKDIFDTYVNIQPTDPAKLKKPKNTSPYKNNMYEIQTLGGARLGGDSRIYYWIYLMENRMEIITSPKGKNKTPVINYKDITNVERKLGISWVAVALAVILFIALIMSCPPISVFALLLVLFGLYHKVVIYRTNGTPVTIHTVRSKKIAEEFISEIKLRTGIA